MRALFAFAVVVAAALSLNFVYQAVRKPSELLIPVSSTLSKTPAQTWRSYGTAFRKQSTAAVSPQLLAALAQTETSGNPIARTYWHWAWSLNPFKLYRPASTAMGMYQITDGTFAQAKRLCVQDHQVRRAGSKWNTCWFNFAYTRVLPGDAIELTAAYLDDSLHAILAHNSLLDASHAQTDGLAAVVHLCGVGTAERYAKHGFRFARGERCGDQDPRLYVARVRRYEAVFSELAAES